MSRIVFSGAARQDRQEITAYTARRFGIQQARRLRDRFEAALNALADAPLIGRTNEELAPAGHRFRHFVIMNTFIIAYQPTAEGIRVARLLRGARNLAAELGRDRGDAARPKAVERPSSSK